MPQGSLTPTEFVALTNSIKARIVELIEKELIPGGAPQQGDRLPVVKKRIIVDRLPDNWAAKLKSPRHVVGGEPKVHAIMVGFGGIEDYADRTTRSVAWRLRFLMRHYLYDFIGNDQDNAELLQAAEVFAVAHRLMTTRPFG